MAEGVVLDVDIADNTMHIFTIAHNIVKVEIYENEKFVKGDPVKYDKKLGKVYTSNHDFSVDKDEYFSVEMKNDELYLKTVAARPHWRDLSLEVRKRVSADEAWSPRLHILADPEDLIEDVEELWEVVVKFEKTQEPQFVIVSAEPIQQELCHAHLLLSAPWGYDGTFENSEKIAQPHKKAKIRHQFDRISSEAMAFGVCIATRHPNYLFDKNKPGSCELVDYIFDASIGAFKHIRKVEEPALVVGKWYRCQLNDSRAKGCEQKKRNRNHQCDRRCQKAHLTALTARDLIPHDSAPMRTWYDLPNPEQKEDWESRAQFKAECSFIFNRENLVNKFSSIKDDAHFFDILLGKIEIYPEIAGEILEKIDKHRAELSERKLEKLINIPIKITVRVSLFKRWQEKCVGREQLGALFFADELRRMEYTVGYEDAIYEMNHKIGDDSLSS